MGHYLSDMEPGWRERQEREREVFLKERTEGIESLIAKVGLPRALAILLDANRFA